jgi:hypothetical protein
MPGTEARAAVGVSPAIICEGRREKEGNSVRIGVWGKRKKPDTHAFKRQLHKRVDSRRHD